MAVTTFGTNDALAVKLWAKALTVEALAETYIQRFIGEGSNSLIHQKTDFSTKAGDSLTFGLRGLLTGRGVTENQVLVGNEESLTTYSDKLVINELRHAVRVRNKGTIDDQRVTFDMRKEAKDGLVEWFSDRYDQIFFTHICGNTLVTDPAFTGNNQVLAATRIVRPGTATDDISLTAANQSFTLDLLDRAVERAKLAKPLFRPIRYKGSDKWVCFLHPIQVTSLRTNTSTGQWLDIQKAALAGGEGKSSGIYTGALGEYNNVVLHETVRLPNGISNAGVSLPNVRRAVLCGAQAACIGFGGATPGLSSYKWSEDDFDYEQEMGFSVRSLFGLKKIQYPINGVATDFATIVIPTYALPS